MKKYKNYSMIIFLMIITFYTNTVESGTITTQEWAVALNLSGRQRMLSQKMAKEFLLTKLNIEIQKNKALQQKTMAMFERTLTQLINGDKELNIPAAPNNEILMQLKTVQSLWEKYKQSLKNDDIDAVTRLNLSVLKNMNDAVGMYEKASIAAGIKSSGTVINVAGRQRMLSQKMSKEICLIVLNKNTTENLNNLSATKDLFNKSHNGLINGNSSMNLVPTTDERCKKQMAIVDTLWKSFKVLIEKIISDKSASQETLFEVYKQNPILLNQMNRAVKLYEVTAK